MELNSLGCAHRELAEADIARPLFEESIAAARAAGDDGRWATALSNLGILEADQHRMDRAIELFQEALHLDQILGDPWGVATDHSNLAAAMVQAGRIHDAHQTLREHASRTLALGDVELSINLIETWCVVFAELADPAKAARLLGDHRAAQLGRDADRGS